MATVEEIDRGLAELLVKLHNAAAKAGTVLVGIQEDIGTKPHGNGEISNADLSAVLEYGTLDGHIPARPHFRATMQENQSKYTEMTGKLLSRFFDRQITEEKALGLLGTRIANDIRRKIQSGVPPENAASTIRAKGSDKPLVNRGDYMRSITHKVVAK